jgi:enamine deaminase RidA (YjgF/YER057c/UK114 family)
MPIERFNPPGVPKPGSNYSQAVIHPGGGRRLIIAGQVGAHADGAIPASLQEQIELAFGHVATVLAAAGMGPEHLVKLTAYALSPEALPLYRAARDRLFGGHPPATTYVQVAALASPAFLFEVDGEAWAP